MDLKDNSVSEDQPGEDDTSNLPLGKTKVYIARGSIGYYDEVEVTREEALNITRADGARRGGERRAWRFSEIGVVDLTGEDDEDIDG